MTNPNKPSSPTDIGRGMLPRVVWVSTGGTIAGTLVDDEASWRYQSAQRSGESLLSAMPMLLRQAQWRVEEAYAIGSQHLELKHMWLLRSVLIKQLADPNVDAILVTHGTDTMEDMLFFLYLTLPPSLMTKPLVFTGAMLPSDHVQADGPGNIQDAFNFLMLCLVHASADFLPFGLVMQGLFTPANRVKKLSTAGLDAFDGPYSVDVRGNWPNLLDFSDQEQGVDELANLGVMGQGAYFTLLPEGESVPPLFESMEVAVLYCAPGNGALRQLQDLNTRKPAAVVVAAPGHGNIPDNLIVGLRRLLNSGVHVVRASRVLDGGVVAGGECDALDSYKEHVVGRGRLFESGHLSLPQCVVAARLCALAQVLG